MEKTKNLVKFIFEHQTRLSCIIRFSNTPRQAPESVAEHSYYVAFLAMVIGDHLQKKGVKLDKLRLLQMALLHDMEEAISGDIIAPIKQGAFKNELNKENVKNMLFLTTGLEEEKAYFSLWHEAGESATVEAKVLKLADRMSCVIYCVREIHLGNRYFRAILEGEAKTMLKRSKNIPHATEFVKEFVDYVLSYLLGDREIYDAINKAVRIYDDGDY